MSILHKITAFITKSGKTTFGKAVEHAVVAGAALGITLAVKDVSTGSLSLHDLSAVAVTAGTAILAGLRAAAKAQTSTVEKAVAVAAAPVLAAAAPASSAPTT